MRAHERILFNIGKEKRVLLEALSGCTVFPEGKRGTVR